jgi:hypothetical protein
MHSQPTIWNREGMEHAGKNEQPLRGGSCGNMDFGLIVYTNSISINGVAHRGLFAVRPKTLSQPGLLAVTADQAIIWIGDDYQRRPTCSSPGSMKVCGKSKLGQRENAIKLLAGCVILYTVFMIVREYEVRKVEQEITTLIASTREFSKLSIRRAKPLMLELEGSVERRKALPGSQALSPR